MRKSDWVRIWKAAAVHQYEDDDYMDVRRIYVPSRNRFSNRGETSGPCCATSSIVTSKVRFPRPTCGRAGPGDFVLVSHGVAVSGP